MSTKGSLFYGGGDKETHVYHDILDNMIHIEAAGHVVITPETWRDIVAECAAASLRNARPFKLDNIGTRPLCVKCGLPDVGHFTLGPCDSFEAKP